MREDERHHTIEFTLISSTNISLALWFHCEFGERVTIQY